MRWWIIKLFLLCSAAKNVLTRRQVTRNAEPLSQARRERGNALSWSRPGSGPRGDAWLSHPGDPRVLIISVCAADGGMLWTCFVTSEPCNQPRLTHDAKGLLALLWSLQMGQCEDYSACARYSAQAFCRIPAAMMLRCGCCCCTEASTVWLPSRLRDAAERMMLMQEQSNERQRTNSTEAILKESRNGTKAGRLTTG